MTKNRVTHSVSPLEQISPETWKKIVKIKETTLLDVKIAEIMHVLNLDWKNQQEVSNARVFRALETFEGLCPRDASEYLLVLQMIGTHDAALECLRRAAIPGQTFEARDVALKHGQRLMSLYTKQLAALDRHRGRGKQRVIVEHVNVEPGGQAFVGNVSQAQSGAAIEQDVDVKTRSGNVADLARAEAVESADLELW